MSVLRQLYLVAPADEGWAVTLGAKSGQGASDPRAGPPAREDRGDRAMAEDMALGFMDADLADEGDRTA